MCAYETPSEGGLTEFVSTRAAYRRLPEAEQAALDPSYHDPRLHLFALQGVAGCGISSAL